MCKISIAKILFLPSVLAISFSQISCNDQLNASIDSTLKASDHFDPKGKAPSKYTLEKWENWKKSLPFDDKRDFEEQKKGFIASPDSRQIMTEDGSRAAWDIGRYDFLLEDKEFKSIHPSLQRVATLNMNYGLYEVTEGIYQVRGFDLANITFVKGNTGWIIFDPMTSAETAAAALKLANQHLGERPIAAIVYSHTHGDHFGGIVGLISPEDAKSGKVKVIAPVEFMDHAVSENVYPGNAMSRRLFYQYGILLPVSPYGHVDQSIGKNISNGRMGLIEPNLTIYKPLEEHTIDGVKMVFHNTPGTEAPAEMNTYFPEKKALWMAENISATIHNIYTLRGAMVRNALEWSKKINEALYLFGDDADVMFASHSWPRWGNERLQETMRAQRDAYANLNNGVLNLANKGVTVNEVHNVYEVPESLKNQWAARSYHGSVQHNSRAIINRFLGYWDANPATIIPLPQAETAPLFVEMMGGSDNIIKKGQELFDTGQYLMAVEILNKLVFAEPSNQKGKDLLADCYEQVGYQQESPSLRNSFLAGAYDLRNGIPSGVPIKSASPDVVMAMGTELWLDFLAIKLNSKRVGDLEFTMNLITPDNGEKFVVELSNATLNTLEGFQSKNPDIVLTINRSDLNLVLTGQSTLANLLGEGKAKGEGNLELFMKLKGALDEFDPVFEILPGTTKTKSEPTGDVDFAMNVPELSKD